jgi:hypothetical protein
MGRIKKMGKRATAEKDEDAEGKEKKDAYMYVANGKGKMKNDGTAEGKIKMWGMVHEPAIVWGRFTNRPDELILYQCLFPVHEIHEPSGHGEPEKEPEGSDNDMDD